MRFFALILAVLCGLAACDARVTCYDERQDLENMWMWYPPSAPVNYVATKDGLPAAVKKLDLPGNGLWYLEGAGTGQEYKLTMLEKFKPYQTRSTNVQIYVSYYDKNPRRGTVEPVKSLLPLQQLPVTTGNTWSEARFDVDPKSDQPLELSFFLSRNHFVVIDKIIVTVDEPLPKNPTTACSVNRPTTTAAPMTSSSTSRTGSSLTGRPTPDGACQMYALPECKCNCQCNCPKC